ncbi:MAG: hypothetical protein PGN07_01375 [Aeromicrobium erythreum]
MRVLTMSLTGLLLAGLGACGGDDDRETPEPTSTASTRSASPTPADDRDPAAQVRRLVAAIDDGDCRTVRRLVVTPDAVDCSDIEASQGTLADEGIELDRVRYVVVERTSSDARVRVDWTPGRESVPAESFDLQRVAGAWRVVLDSAA